MRHNVSGYVRNLNDGKVELVLEGPNDEIQAVTETLKERMSGYIQQIDQTLLPATGEFAHFSIRHC